MTQQDFHSLSLPHKYPFNWMRGGRGDIYHPHIRCVMHNVSCPSPFVHINFAQSLARDAALFSSGQGDRLPSYPPKPPMVYNPAMVFYKSMPTVVMLPYQCVLREEDK